MRLSRRQPAPRKPSIRPVFTSSGEAVDKPMAPRACRCGARWSGSTTTHHSSPGCHLTFSGVTAFDKHLTRDGCEHPSKVTTKEGDLLFEKRAARGTTVWGFVSTGDEWWKK